MKMVAAVVLVVLVSFWAAQAYVPVDSTMRSFSSAIKNGMVKPDMEKVLYEHSTGQPGVITEQWFTGEDMLTDASQNSFVYFDISWGGMGGSFA